MSGVLALLSFVIVAFGQPAWSWELSILSASFGFALFWSIIIHLPTAKRFWMATLWFFAIQMVQLSWMVSHPYGYIYAVYTLLSFALGVQFGILGILFDPEKINRFSRICLIASVWTIMEWARLLLMSGFSFNPVGLSLASTTISLQTASLAGVFGLSFIVMFTNLLALRAWLSGFSFALTAMWIAAALFPYLYGGAHFLYHSKQMELQSDSFETLLVQTAFPAEEALQLKNHDEWLQYVLKEWDQILQITKSHKTDLPLDLVALPEAVVPFGTYTFMYPYEDIKKLFLSAYGEEGLQLLPPLELPWAFPFESKWYVNNAFMAQAVANYFDAPVIAGLEDAEDVDGAGHRAYYAAAIYFQPQQKEAAQPPSPLRYAKRVLLPMGEYIPFSFCKSLAAQYGVSGSFSPGNKTQVWHCKNTPVGISICYEETFGNMMRENAQMGAKVLLNITSDIWYPHSRLVRQHLEHARLRTVENGIPLIRSCNTGITCAVDALGRDIALLGENDSQRQSLSASLRVKVPLYTYSTPYTYFGDKAIILFCFILVLTSRTRTIRTFRTIRTEHLCPDCPGPSR